MKVVRAHRVIVVGLIVIVSTIAFVTAGCDGNDGPDQASTGPGSSTTSQAASAENPTTTTVEPAEAPTTVPSIPAGAGLSLEQVRNAEITIGAGEDALSFTLVDGSYQSGQGNDPDRVKVTLMGVAAFGDLNGDGTGDAAIAIRVRQGAGGGQGVGQGKSPGKPGGTPSNSDNAGGNRADERTSEYVVAFLSLEGEAAQAGYYSLGAGARIDSLTIEDERVFAEARVSGLEESPGEAKVPATVGLRLPRDLGLGQSLVLISQSSETPGGDIREIIITSPIPEAMVVGLVEIEGTITIAPFENNLVYQVYDPAMNELGGGPVSVDAADLGAPGSFVFPLDLVSLGCTGWVLVTVSDLSALDGSILALDSIELLNAAPT